MELVELTQERIARHPIPSLKSKYDRIRIQKGGSALSHKPVAASNMMAVQPFSRTGQGHQLMDGIINQHKLNFDYGKQNPLGPSDFAVANLRHQADKDRETARKTTNTGNLLYNGHSNFNNTFYSDARLAT